MVKTNEPKDLASLREVFNSLQAVLESPDDFEIVNFEAEKGTARTQVAENVDHAMQRIGISVTYVGKNDD